MLLTVFEKNGFKYLDFKDFFVNHYRSKNYIAEITDLHPKYGLSRYFLKKWKGAKYSLNLFDKGGIYEIKAVYYTTSGRPIVEHHGFYIFRGVNENEEAYFEEISEDEVYDMFTEPESFSAYLASLLRRGVYDWFSPLLRQHRDKAIYLAEEIANDKSTFVEYANYLPTRRHNEARDILRELAKKYKEAQEGYAALIFAHWKYNYFFYKVQKEIAYLLFTVKPDTRDKIIEYLTKLVKEFFSYNPSLAEILSKLTEEAGEKQEYFDYNAFFERHSQFFEILPQLTKKQQIIVYDFIFSFIMQLIADNLSTKEYNAETKFVYDFFTMLREKTDSKLLIPFLENWKEWADMWKEWADMKFYKKVLRSFLKKLIKEEDLFQLFTEFDSDTRQAFTRVLDEVDLSLVHIKIATKALKKGEYQVFYDILTATDPTALMKKIVSSKTFIEKFYRLPFEKQKEIVDAYIKNRSLEGEHMEIYSKLVAAALANKQKEQFWYFVTKVTERNDWATALGLLGNSIVMNGQALKNFLQLDEEEQEKIINLLARINSSRFDYYDYEITRDTSFYSYYNFAFALARRGKIDLFVKMIEEQECPITSSKDYRVLFIEDLISLTEHLLEKKDVVALGKITPLLNKFRSFTENDSIEQLLKKVSLILTESTNNSVFDL